MLRSSVPRRSNLLSPSVTCGVCNFGRIVSGNETFQRGFIPAKLLVATFPRHHTESSGIGSDDPRSFSRVGLMVLWAFDRGWLELFPLQCHQ